MHKEIGSEFWDAGPCGQSDVFLLSGRTALEYIIRDILKTHDIRSVLLPGYCCHTMIEPFCRHHIKVRFYDIVHTAEGGLRAEFPELLEHEIFYFMTYFGFRELQGVPLDRIGNTAEVILADETHSWLGGNTLKDADYSYCSCRKWTGFPGIALASKKHGVFSEEPHGRNRVYTEMRSRAAAMKRDYLASRTDDKQAFLSLFEEAEELLEKDYLDYLPEPETVNSFLRFDRTRARDARRRNAAVLLSELRDVPEIKLMFSKLAEEDAPLFVPVLAERDRAGLRRHLTENSIYCPCHWPLSEYHAGIGPGAAELYERELSVICDQRYDEEDMHRIADTIKNFYTRK